MTHLPPTTKPVTTMTPFGCVVVPEENLVKVAGDLLAGGTEPPTTTAVWVLLYMIRFPRVQDRCYQVGS